MKYYLILLSLSYFSVLYGQQTILEKELDKNVDPYCLHDMLETYYQYYFDYPYDIEEFIDFQKRANSVYSGWLKTCDSINLSFFDINKDRIRIERQDSLVFVVIDDFVFFKITPPLLPFDLYSKVDFPEDYYTVLKKYSSPRYFKNGRAVIKTDELDSIFEQQKKGFQLKYLKEYKFFSPMFEINSLEYPIYTFFEYKKNHLSYYKGKYFKSNLSFWTAFEKFLKNFTEEYNISRIIFSMPEYRPVKKE